MHKYYLTIIAGLSILIFFMPSCKKNQQNSEPIRLIKTITVQETNLGKIRKFSGIVKAKEASRISFEVGGMVRSVNVNIGDHVEKGQELAILDEEPYKLTVDAAAAELDKAKVNVVNTQVEYERQQRVI